MSVVALEIHGEMMFCPGVALWLRRGFVMFAPDWLRLTPVSSLFDTCLGTGMKQG